MTPGVHHHVARLFANAGKSSIFRHHGQTGKTDFTVGGNHFVVMGAADRSGKLASD